MKVLMVNKFFHMNGGSERVFFQERDFLKRAGFPVVDFSMQDERNLESPFEEFFISPVNYHSQASLLFKAKQAASFIRSSEALRLLAELVERERPDIAHLHNIYHQITPSIIPLLKKKNVKVVLTLHDGKLVCPSYLMLSKGRICESCMGRQFYRAMTSGCQTSISNGILLAVEAYYHKITGSYKGVDAFISPSGFLADFVGRYRIPREKITVLHNGIDTRRYKPSYADEGYALYFGRLSREKGVATLLRAHEIMSKNMPLKVVGMGPMESELRNRYARAELLGYKTGGELIKLIDEASFVIVPSEWYENCSMVVLEAMALGKPVIGSDTGGIPEQIDNGVTGLMFRMGDAHDLAGKMELLWEDKNLRKKMGRSARQKLEYEYSLEEHCARLMKLYDSLLPY